MAVRNRFVAVILNYVGPACKALKSNSYKIKCTKYFHTEFSFFLKRIN